MLRRSRQWQQRHPRAAPSADGSQGALNRSELVWSALTLAQAWVAEGMPRGPVTVGKFESWATTLSGNPRSRWIARAEVELARMERQSTSGGEGSTRGRNGLALKLRRFGNTGESTPPRSGSCARDRRGGWALGCDHPRCPSSESARTESRRFRGCCPRCFGQHAVAAVVMRVRYRRFGLSSHGHKLGDRHRRDG